WIPASSQLSSAPPVSRPTGVASARPAAPSPRSGACSSGVRPPDTPTAPACSARAPRGR
ncbi:MAG: hypothetical protein AVDCRST_MAG79-2443, partial [uncultured Thermoleophilia bacterium]